MDTWIAEENQRNANLDPSWVERAHRELGECPDVVAVSLKRLRRLLYAEREKQEFTRTDDAFLMRFLRAKKYDVEKASKMVLRYVQMKRDCPELFRVSPVDELEFLFDMQIQWMVPESDVYIFRVEKCDPAQCPVDKVFRSNVLSLEHAIRRPEVQIGGLVVLLDMAGLTFGHARFLSANLSKRTVEVIQEAFPMRFRAFHILHEPFYMDAILAVLKPFLKEKIRKRIHLHGKNLASLHRYIPKEALPSQYGGTMAAFDNSTWKREILNDRKYYETLEEFHRWKGDVDGEAMISPAEVPSQIQFIDAETEGDSEEGQPVF